MVDYVKSLMPQPNVTLSETYFSLGLMRIVIQSAFNQLHLLKWYIIQTRANNISLSALNKKIDNNVKMKFKM